MHTLRWVLVSSLCVPRTGLAEAWFFCFCFVWIFDKFFQKRMLTPGILLNTNRCRNTTFGLPHNEENHKGSNGHTICRAQNMILEFRLQLFTAILSKLLKIEKGLWEAEGLTKLNRPLKSTFRTGPNYNLHEVQRITVAKSWCDKHQ